MTQTRRTTANIPANIPAKTMAKAALADLDQAWVYYTPEPLIPSDAPIYEAIPTAA
ncbi:MULTISPECIES: hypothetical protein [unclassified Marinovum]